MACSSRNPQNCLAGANDYRTVDIPFPTIGEKITGDAWLGWYTTKDGGLSWRTRLLPGYPQDTSATGLASPLKGYSAGADPIIRPGTNGLFYYGGLVFDREEGGGSAIFVARFIDNNNQEGTAGESIAYLGASIVQRIGAAPVVVARGRGARPAPRVARGPARPDGTRGARRGIRAGVEQAGTNQMVDKPWIAVDIPRAGAQVCTIGGPGTDAPLQTFPGGRVYMAYALFDGPGEERGRIMFSASADCAKTWSPPRVLSRVQSGDVNDDGVTNAADVARVQASYTRICGQTGFNPNADTNNDCKVDLLDLAYVGKMVGQPVPTQPRLSQGAALAIDPVSGALQIAWRRFNDGVLPDAIVTVRSTNGGTSFSSPTVVAPLGPFEQRTTTTTFRTNAFPTLAIDGTGRAYLAWSARGYAPQNPDPAVRRWPRGDRDVHQRDHLVGAHAGGQPGEPRPSDHAGARVRAGQAATRLLRPARGSIAALRAVRRRAADSRWHARAADPAHGRCLGRPGRSGGESGVHAVPPLAVPLGGRPGRADDSAARIQPPEPPDLPGRQLAVHGRLPRRRAGNPVCADRIDLELQHGADGQSGVPRHLDGQSRHPPAGQRAVDRLHAAESPVCAAGHERVRSRPGDSGVRAGPGRDAQSEHLHRPDHARAWSSARSATPAGSARCSAASRSSPRTTARRSGASG